MGLPSIDVIFKGQANTAVARSQKGVACLILKDVTKDIKKASYKGFTEVSAEDYTVENLKIIEDVFIADVAQLIVIRMGENETFTHVKDNISTDINWVAIIAEEQAEQKALADFVKAENKKRTKRLKQIGYKLEPITDDMHVVNFINDTVTRTDDTQVAGYLYLGRLLGVLASCPLDQAVTYKSLLDLKRVSEIEAIDEAIKQGSFVLINDDDVVRVGRGINSLVTNDELHTEDMKDITIVEGMDLMHEDVVKTFKEQYLGKYKNSYDNQVLFISAINSYFRALQEDEVLDPNFANSAGVDVEKQRAVWVLNGTTEAEAWSERKVKNMTYRKTMYLMANVKFLNAIEDLTFVVKMQ